MAWLRSYYTVKKAMANGIGQEKCWKFSFFEQLPISTKLADTKTY